MKEVTLVATITANGQILLAEQTRFYQASPEVLGIFIQKAIEAGNIVFGRTTYEVTSQIPGMKEALSGVESVVLSATLPEDTEGCHVVRTPQEAVEYLQAKGHDKMLVAGGTKTYNAFLSANLISEMYLSIVPIAVNGGGILQTQKDSSIRFLLAEAPEVIGEVVRLHYKKN